MAAPFSFMEENSYSRINAMLICFIDANIILFAAHIHNITNDS